MRAYQWLIVAVILIAQPAVSLTACKSEPPLPPPAEIVSGVAAAVDNLSSYRITTFIRARLRDFTMDEIREMNAVIVTDGIIDVGNEELELTIDTLITGSPDQNTPPEQKVEMFQVDGMFYIKAPGMYDIPEWQQSGAWEGLFDIVDYAGMQQTVLVNSTIIVTSTEIVEDVECYVLELTPEKEQISTTLAGLAWASEGAYLFAAFQLNKHLDWDMVVKQWVARDSFFIVKTEASIDIEFLDVTFGPEEEPGGINFLLISDMRDHNKEFEIELSPEAAAAVPAPG